VDLGKQFEQQHSALSVASGSSCLTCRSTVAVIKPRSNDGTSDALCNIMRQRTPELSQGVTVDENYNPGLPLSLECRASSMSRL